MAKCFDSAVHRHRLDTILSHVIHRPSEDDYVLMTNVITILLKSTWSKDDQRLDDPIHVFVTLAQPHYSGTFFRNYDGTIPISDVSKAVVIFGRSMDIVQRLLNHSIQRHDGVFNLIKYMSLYVMCRSSRQGEPLWELACDCLSPEVISHFWYQDPIEIDRIDFAHTPEAHMSHALRSLMCVITGSPEVYTGWKCILDAYPPTAFRILSFHPNGARDLVATRTVLLHVQAF